MIAKRVSHNIYDFFFGQGWEDWVRVVYKKKTKELIPIKGRQISEFEKAAIINAITKE